MIRSFTFILFAAFSLHCGQSQAQYVVLEEEKQKALLEARVQAIEEAKAARPYDGYIEPTTQRQIYAEDYNPEQRSQKWAEQEQLLAEEKARLEAKAALTEEAINTAASATGNSQEQTAEEDSTEDTDGHAEEGQEISSENNIKPLYDEGTPVRKTIAQRRSERRAAKKKRVFR